MNPIVIKGERAEALFYPPEAPQVRSQDALRDAVLKPALERQIAAVASYAPAEGQQIRIMPDAHPGKTGPIGLTMTVGDKLMPGLVGVDIGCGVTVMKIAMKMPLDCGAIDKALAKIQSERRRLCSEAASFDFSGFRANGHFREDAARKALGTLGGGNHFIELDRGKDGEYWLAVHSGSRVLGAEIGDFYLKAGQKALAERGIEVPYAQVWLEDALFEDYLCDVQKAAEFASLNRRIIIRSLASAMKWKCIDEVESIHNYVDLRFGTPMVRKGAISARRDEPVVIPINMRDGILIGHGLGNPEWNHSAPHGAGRIVARRDMHNLLTVSAFRRMMDEAGVKSQCIRESTIDEAPIAYHAIEEILPTIADTVMVTERLKPVWSYKAS